MLTYSALTAAPEKWRCTGAPFVTLELMSTTAYSPVESWIPIRLWLFFNMYVICLFHMNKCLNVNWSLAVFTATKFCQNIAFPVLVCPMLSPLREILFWKYKQSLKFQERASIKVYLHNFYFYIGQTVSYSTDTEINVQADHLQEKIWLTGRGDNLRIIPDLYLFLGENQKRKDKSQDRE